MAIVRWDPASELSSLQGEMNRLFNGFFGAEGSGSRRWVPPMDVFETPGHFVARIDLPGIGDNDVDVEVRDNVLVVSGERGGEHSEQIDGWYRFERSTGRFTRQLTLPDGVDPDAIAASFERGVLELRIPKPEQRKPRKVVIGRPEAVEAEGGPR